MSQEDQIAELLRDRFGEMGRRLGRIEGALDAHGGKVDRLSEKVGVQNGRVASLEGWIERHAKHHERTDQRAFDNRWHWRHVLTRTAIPVTSFMALLLAIIELLTHAKP